MISQRRRRALQALVERGATPGEREAARVALAKADAADRPATPPGGARTHSAGFTINVDEMVSGFKDFKVTFDDWRQHEERQREAWRQYEQKQRQAWETLFKQANQGAPKPPGPFGDGSPGPGPKKCKPREAKDMPGPRPCAANVPMFIDSGAYSELDKYDRWMWPAHDFAEFVVGLCRALGTVEHAGIQDWMCEAHMLAKTGLTVEEHQRRTVLNFCLLRRLQRSVPWLPTLQGYTVEDYMRCAQMYRDAGVRLEDHALVGLGSVCRRSRTLEIERVIREVVAGLGTRVALHGFGVKSEGALLACWGLASVDSMAWSTRARYDERDLRTALSLPADAPAELVMSATDAQLRAVDMDLEDFWRWKRERCPKTAANSLEYAETWRLRQTMALAARLVDEVIAQREQARRADPLLTLPSRRQSRPVHPGQLGLWC